MGSDAENGLKSAIEVLKAEGLDTLTLYVRVCHVMFFTFGLQPSPTRLYEHVRKGSMSVPGEALKLFWAEVRENGRMKLDNAALPVELHEFAGDVLGQLWHKAVQAAESSMATYREACEKATQHAETRATSAEGDAKVAWARVEDLINAQTQLQEAAEELRRAIAVEKARSVELERELAEQRQQTLTLRQDLAKAADAFELERDRFQEQLSNSELRHKEAQHRWMQEVDNHRVENKALRTRVETITEQVKAEALRAERDQAQLRERVVRAEVAQNAADKELERTLTQIRNLEMALSKNLSKPTERERGRVKQVGSRIKAKTLRRNQT